MVLAEGLELQYNYKTCFQLELEAILLGWNINGLETKVEKLYSGFSYSTSTVIWSYAFSV